MKQNTTDTHHKPTAPIKPISSTSQPQHINPLAPIVLFTYNRPSHTKHTIQALIANNLAKQCTLYIYQDAPKDTATHQQKASAQEVSAYLHALIQENTEAKYFAAIHLTQQTHNLGLATSIISGVSSVLTKHKNIIVLEDDIVTSPVFLDYMNAALTRYEAQKRVWSIAGWGYPINPSGLGDAYFWRVPHCWGWASWADRWQYFSRDISLGDREFSRSDIHYINLDGASDFFSHYTLNKKGKITTWAIFNYLIAYKKGALTLCPSISYIKQIGFDNSGTHCGEDGKRFNPPYINTTFPITFPTEIIESTLALERIRAFELAQRRTIITRIVNKLIRITQANIHAIASCMASMLIMRGGGGKT